MLTRKRQNRNKIYKIKKDWIKKCEESAKKKKKSEKSVNTCGKSAERV